MSDLDRGTIAVIIGTISDLDNRGQYSLEEVINRIGGMVIGRRLIIPWIADRDTVRVVVEMLRQEAPYNAEEAKRICRRLARG